MKKEAIQQLFLEKKILDNILHVDALGGGCINQAFRVRGHKTDFFIKAGPLAAAVQFEKEALGLALLSERGRLRIPQVVCSGLVEGMSYLILEFIEPAPRGKNYWEDLGAGLAIMHEQQAAAFGLDTDNYIGSLEQPNAWEDDWLSFFIKKRLDFQLHMAEKKQNLPGLRAKFEHLYQKLPSLLCLGNPSLLHGDLWSGNVVIDELGNPCLIDPAVYYGHREVELAFTTLFGGFDLSFYAAYLEVAPLEKGFEERFDIYNIYPLLVHYNLFGGGYLNSVLSVLKRFS